MPRLMRRAATVSLDLQPCRQFMKCVMHALPPRRQHLNDINDHPAANSTSAILKKLGAGPCPSLKLYSLFAGPDV